MYKKSFTLIELLVTIGIVVLLTVGIVAGLSSGKQKRQVKATAESLKTLITEARQMAVTPNDTAYGLQKVQVRIYKNEQKVEVWEISSSGSTNVTPGGKFSVPSGIKIGPPDGTTGNMSCNLAATCNNYYYFGFNAVVLGNANIGHLTDVASANENVKIQVSDTAGSEKYILTIDKVSGYIELK